MSQADSVFPIFWILPHPIKWQNWFCYFSWLITNQNLTLNRLCIHLRVCICYGQKQWLYWFRSTSNCHPFTLHLHELGLQYWLFCVIGTTTIGFLLMSWVRKVPLLHTQEWRCVSFLVSSRVYTGFTVWINFRILAFSLCLVKMRIILLVFCKD